MSSSEGLESNKAEPNDTVEEVVQVNGQKDAPGQSDAKEASKTDVPSLTNEAVAGEDIGKPTANDETAPVDEQKDEVSVSAPTEGIKSAETADSGAPTNEGDVSKSDVDSLASKLDTDSKVEGDNAKTVPDPNNEQGNEDENGSGKVEAERPATSDDAPAESKQTNHGSSSDSQAETIQTDTQVEQMEATTEQPEAAATEPEPEKTASTDPPEETSSGSVEDKASDEPPKDNISSDSPEEQATSSDPPKEKLSSDPPEEQTTGSDPPGEKVVSDPQEPATNPDPQEVQKETDSPTKKSRGRSKASTPKRGRRAPAKAAAAEKDTEGEVKRAGNVDVEKAEAMDTTETNDPAGSQKLGLVERPVEIMTGKRNRRKVERLSENMATTPATPADKKKFSVPEGEGVRLGDCPAIEEVINRTKAEELKMFHKVLYGVPGKSPPEIKKHVRAFCGWTFEVDDADYKKKVVAVSKTNMPVLKSWCSMLKLTVGGSKDALVERIMGYLMKPTADGKDLQAKDKKSETGKRKRGAAKESKEEVEAESEEESVQSEEEEEEEPVIKKRKTSARKSPAKQTKAPAKPAAKAGRSRARMSAPNVAEEEEADDGGRPTDAVIKRQIEKILKTADLEIVTMKTVRQQILDMYADFDLSDKKDFIKSTVKQILGA